MAFNLFDKSTWNFDSPSTNTGMQSLFNKGAKIFSNFNGLSDLWDQFKNGRTNVVNKDIADQNLGFQRENLDYQKALQQEIFEREDTAYQRTANDIRMAGLNPLSMQGTNGAGEAIATEPLNNSQQYSDTSNFAALKTVLDTLNQISTSNSNASLNEANANLLNAQAKNQEIKNIYEQDMMAETLNSIRWDNGNKKLDYNIRNIDWLNAARDYNFMNQFGITNSMPDIAKLFNIATHQGNSHKYIDKMIYNPYTNYTTNENDYNFSNIQSILDNNTELKGSLTENKITSWLLQLLGVKL